MNSIRVYYFPVLLLTSALSISMCSAYFSVTGLASLFIGAKMSVIIMASCLEFSKLVIASVLHNYWQTINKLLRIYLTIALITLILITSVGVYGYLSAAYQSTSNSINLINTKINNIESKKIIYSNNLDKLVLDKISINNNINNLNNALSNNIQLNVDKFGNKITTSSKSNRKSFEKQLEINNIKLDKIVIKIDNINDSIAKFNNQILDIKLNDNNSNDIGPLIYISELTGIKMNMIINILMLIIIFVFDPLAISLVLAFNFQISLLRNKSEATIADNNNVIKDDQNTEEQINTELDSEHINKLKQQLDDTSLSEWTKNKIKEDFNGNSGIRYF